MHRTVEKLMQRYGTPMTLQKDGESFPIRAFLQDTQSRSQENAKQDMSPLGRIGTGMYVYMGPVEPAAAAGDYITMDGKCFQVRRAENVMVGSKAAYRWGLCVEKGGEDTWGS